MLPWMWWMWQRDEMIINQQTVNAVNVLFFFQTKTWTFPVRSRTYSDRSRVIIACQHVNTFQHWKERKSRKLEYTSSVKVRMMNESNPENCSPVRTLNDWWWIQSFCQSHKRCWLVQRIEQFCCSNSKDYLTVIELNSVCIPSSCHSKSTI